jgi:Ca2+-binding RTX toxin-like protein
MAIVVGNNLPNNLNGTFFNDTIAGQGGSDTLNGGLGNDTLKGGTGFFDTLNGGFGTDTADYSNGFLNPTGPAGPVFTIGATAGVTVNLNLAGFQNTGGAGFDRLSSIENVTGTNFNDSLIGNAANNVLSGLGGNDFLSGLAGNDQLLGGTGNDTLNGGTGNDTLTGGTGRDLLTGGTGFDTFDYNAASDSPAGAGRDQIVGFDGNGAFLGDRIDLSTIDANAFLLGNQAFTAAQLSYAGGILSANIIGTAPAPDLQIQLVGAPALVLSDIVL